MLDKIRRHIAKRVLWHRHQRLLVRVRTRADYEALLKHHALRPPYVTDSADVSARKRQAAATVLDSYGIDVAGRRVLDIGPGYGDALDVCRERGAMTLGLDHDPFVVRWLQLRGHFAVRGNILSSALPLQGQLFDLITATGSLVVEYFSLVGMGRLRALLARLEQLRAPDGTILICPFFEVTGPQRRRKIADPLKCPFTDTMLGAGYQIMPRLPGVHDDNMYCITYGKLGKPLAPDRHTADVWPAGASYRAASAPASA